MFNLHSSLKFTHMSDGFGIESRYDVSSNSSPKCSFPLYSQIPKLKLSLITKDLPTLQFPNLILEVWITESSEGNISFSLCLISPSFPPSISRYSLSGEGF